MNTTTFTGVLNFYSWFSPWFIVNGEQKTDFFPEVAKLFKSLNGKLVTFDDKLESFSFKRDQSSEWRFVFKQETDSTTAVLEKPRAGSSMVAHISEVLRRINGRKVCITITDTSLEVQADLTEEILKIPYTNNNEAAIPEGKEETVCKIGTGNTCIFCSNSTGSWECLKGGSFGTMLLQRLQKGKTAAARIGNCLIAGRVEEKVGA